MGEHVRFKKKVLLHRRASPALDSRIHNRLQLAVWMDARGLSTGPKASTHHDSFGNRGYGISSDVVSLAVAQIPQSICTTGMVQKTVDDSAMDFLSVDAVAGDYRGDAGGLH